jgi:hypothetical protein
MTLPWRRRAQVLGCGIAATRRTIHIRWFVITLIVFDTRAKKFARRMIDVEDIAIGAKQTISEGGFTDDLCTPDTVSPAQFQEMWCGTPEPSAEFKLALAVLEQAVEDLQHHRGASASEPQRLYVQARRWVASNDRRWPYSFANVCDMLNLSCGRMRTRLLAEHPTARLDVVGAGVPLEVVGTIDVDVRDEAPLEEELHRQARA